MDRTISAGRLSGLLATTRTVDGAAYQSLADAIRRLIADGRISTGVRLPSERELTKSLGVSRTTVTRAYAALRDLGFLQSRQGSGSVAVLPGETQRRQGGLVPGVGDEDAIDLTCAALSAPPGFLDATEAAVQALPAHLGARGYHPLGLSELRTAIAERFTARGLPTDAEQIMITSGALSGVAAAMRALLSTGDRILMESPTYPNAIETARRSGARPVAIPLDPGGWDTGALVATLRQTAPRAAYLMPDFHNPTGALMPDTQRREVARALQATHTIPIIDETFVGLDLGPQHGDVASTRPLAAFHPHTVTVGGAGKSHWGGLRIGWVRAPRDLFPAIADARLTFDLSAPLLEQLIMIELLRRDDDIQTFRRERVRDSRDALSTAVHEQLPDWSFRIPIGGLCLWIELPQPLSTSVVVAAERHGVILASGPQFAVEGGMERFIRLPYADHDPALLHEVVRRLALAWQDAQSQAVVRRGPTRLVA